MIIITIITIIIIIIIHKTVKTNNKIRRFGIVMTPLSRKNVFDHARSLQRKTLMERIFP